MSEDNTIPFPTVDEMVDILLSDGYKSTVHVLNNISTVDIRFISAIKYYEHPEYPNKKNRYKIIRLAAEKFTRWGYFYLKEPSEKIILKVLGYNYENQEDAKSEFNSILREFGIDSKLHYPAFNKKVLKAISKLPKRKLKSRSGYITISKLNKMIDECFKITVKLGMLEQERIDVAVIKIFNKPKGATKAGRRNGKIFMQFNFGYSAIHTPDNGVFTENFINHIEGKNNREQLFAVREAQLRGKFAKEEYLSYWRDKDIGLWTGNSEGGGWRVIVAHEMAHVVNYNSPDDKWRGRGHGAEFKKVYRILRKKMLS